MLLIIVICLLAIGLIAGYFYYNKSFNWLGYWSSDMNPGVTFKIDFIEKNKVLINGEIFETKRNKIYAYGIKGELQGEIIIWENKNIWHRILEPLPPLINWFDIWHNTDINTYIKIYKEGETVYIISSNRNFKIPVALEGNKLLYAGNVLGVIENDNFIFSHKEEKFIFNRAVGIDPNISVSFYGKWKENSGKTGDVFIIEPNKTKKGFVNIKFGTQVVEGEINGSNIKMFDGKFSGIMTDEIIKWDKTVPWIKEPYLK